MSIHNGRDTQEDFGNYAKVTVASENTFTDAITVQARSFYANQGRVNVSIDPTDAVLTVTVQRQYTEETSEWHDCKSYKLVTSNEDIEDISVSPSPETIKYRIGVKTGEYTSGSVKLRVGSY